MKRSLSTRLLFAALLPLACKAKDEVAPPTDRQAQALSAPVASRGLAADQVYAASSHLRIVDVGAGHVVKNVDLGRAVRNLAFTPDGRWAVVAASDGVRIIDADKSEVLAQPTQHPTRWVELDDAGQHAYALEHQVTVGPNDTREISPFSLVTIDVATAQVSATEEIGQRILYARPPTKELHGLVVSDAGEVGLVPPGQPLKKAQPFDLSSLVPQQSRIRHFPMVRGGVAFIPVEAEPARIVAIDLSTRASQVYELPGMITLRGLALSKGGQTLVVSSGGSVALVDLKKGGVARRFELGAPSTGAALASDGRTLYLAQTVDGDGGAVLVVDLEAQKIQRKIHLDDISPWAIDVRPRAALAAR